MRFVIYGAGAIGGTVGVRLHQSGHEVVLIARGAHHDAIVSRGLTLETPAETTTHRISVFRRPGELRFHNDDVVLVAVKSQGTEAVLTELREACPGGVPVVLLQNGIENERTALRIMPAVYGALVMSPTSHLQPGVVQAYGTDQTGKIDVGRYPGGVDEIVDAVTSALARSDFASLPNPDIMTAKRAKLISNLANAVQVVCGLDAPGLEELAEEIRQEGMRVFDAAGLSYTPANAAHDPNITSGFTVGEIEGAPRGGGSSWQSLMRGTPLETDYLTGEIVLQARLISTRAPLNEALLALVHTTVVERRAPGWMTPAEVRAAAASSATTDVSRMINDETTRNRP
jgi:2-dehydropantoate 2-reductase